MITIDVYSNYSVMTGEYDYLIVDKATRFRKTGYKHVRAYKTHQWDGYTRLFNKRNGVFPTGLKDRIIKYYKKQAPGSLIEVIDHRKFKNKKLIPKIENVKLDGITLRDHQIKACRAMLRQRNGVLWASTNSGKTACAIAVIKALNLNTLFLVKGKDLVLQTYDRFKNRLGENDVGIITANKWDVKKFNVASTDTLSRRLSPPPSRRGKNSEKNKKLVEQLLTSVDVVIVDECHQLASDGAYNVLKTCTAPYRYGLSGTPFKRGDKQDLKLIAMTGEVCYKITNKEMIEDGVSVPAEINLIDIEHPNLGNQINYVDAYDLGIINNEYRNTYICGVTESYYNKGKSVLIIVKNIEHGNGLDELLYSFREDAFIPHTFIHGSTPMEERTEAIESFKTGVTKVMIASSILDQGIDIPSIDVIIFACGGNSQIRAIQRIGRGLRLNDKKDKLIIIDFTDRTNKYLAKHSIDRIKTYQNEDCFDINLINNPREFSGVHQ